MSGWEMKIITAEAHRLLALAADDPELRADLRALAEEILAATGQTISPAETDLPSTPTPEPLRKLTLGQSRPPSDAALLTHSSASLPDESDVQDIAARCRQKAESIRWAAERRRIISEGGDVSLREAPGDPLDVDWAERLAESADRPGGPPELARLDDVAGCFDAVALALAFADDSRGRPKGLERALPLVAEAQSALRVSLRAVDDQDDPHQRQVFDWLKATATRHHVFIKRYMRADDLANPARWPDLHERIEAAQRGPRPTQPREASTAPAVSHEPTAEVAEAARLLAGKGVLLIGGSRRREAEEALEKAFGLEELVWVETKEHQATSTFEPLIARPDVALVLLAIRWSSHAFGDVRQFCERHNKPLVRLPGGYNPNQVAAQVLAQCSAQLRQG